jgi:hypothetical protein
MDIEPTSQSSIRPRWQFSLGDLMLLTTVVAAHLAAYTAIMRGMEFPRDEVRTTIIVSQMIVATSMCGFQYSFIWWRSGAQRFRLRLRRPFVVSLIKLGSAPLLSVIAAVFLPVRSQFPDSARVGLLYGISPDYSCRVGRGRATRWWVFANRQICDHHVVGIAEATKRPKSHRRLGLLDPPYAFMNNPGQRFRSCFNLRRNLAIDRPERQRIRGQRDFLPPLVADDAAALPAE